MSDFFDVAMAEDYRRATHADETTFARGAEWGAGWAFAIVGMGQALHDQYAGQLLDDHLRALVAGLGSTKH